MPRLTWQRITEKTTQGLLTAGATLSEAAFSGVGALLLQSGRELAIASASCAAMIEWAVFAPNIAGGLRLLTRQDPLWIDLIERELQVKLHQDSLQKNQFLKTYWAYHDYHAYLASLHKLTSEQQQQLKEYTQVLTEMRDAVKRNWQGETNSQFSNENQNLIKEINDLFLPNERQPLSAEITCKQRRLQIAYATIPFAMLGCYFATYSAAVAILPYLAGASLAAGTLVFLPYVIAGCAALAFGLSVLCTDYRLVRDDLIQDFCREQKARFQPAGWLGRIALILAWTLFVGMVIGLLLASGGTWWHAGMAGYHQLFGVALLAAKVVVGVTLVAYIGLTQLFYLRNMLQTLTQLLAHSGSAIVTAIGREVKLFFSEPYILLLGDDSEFKDAAWWVRGLLCPLVIVALLLRYAIDILFKVWALAVFIAHCVSEGVTVDNSFLLPTFIAALLRSLQEALTDLHYVTELKPQSDLRSSESVAVQVSNASQPCDHVHSQLPQHLLCIALAPVLIPLLALHALLTKKDVQIEGVQNASRTAFFKFMLLRYWGAHTHPTPREPNAVPSGWVSMFDKNKQPVDAGAVVASVLDGRSDNSWMFNLQV